MSELQSLPLAALFTEQALATANLANAKVRVEEVKAELARRYSASGMEALKQLGKEHGTVTLPLQDGLKVKVERKQTVKWDSSALFGIARTLPWERVEALFKFDVSMSETIYKGVSAIAPELRQRIDDARTTKISEPSFTLIREEPLA